MSRSRHASHTVQVLQLSQIDTTVRSVGSRNWVKRWVFRPQFQQRQRLPLLLASTQFSSNSSRTSPSCV
ncbi:MAG: hypothetical protein ACHQ7M_12140 [Chloroflexota bacterium]